MKGVLLLLKHFLFPEKEDPFPLAYNEGLEVECCLVCVWGGGLAAPPVSKTGRKVCWNCKNDRSFYSRSEKSDIDVQVRYTEL